MLPRERVQAALEFRAPDVVPLQVCAAAGGLYEHGQKLADLARACGHDFGLLDWVRPPEKPPPGDFDPDGRYHAVKTDEWGTTWEYRIFGVWGHPLAWPLNDMSKLASYRLPARPALSGWDLAAACDRGEQHRRRYFQLEGGGSIFEKLHSIRRFEDVLMDIELDTPEINRLADMLVDYHAAFVARALAVGTDGVAFGDDFGTQQGPIISPRTWRRFFKPRYRALMDPIVRAGKHIFFHSCGQIEWMLEDLRELGVGAIWPQLPLFDLKDLARRCRELHLAVQLHPDRGELMQRGTPRQVRDYCLRMLDDMDTAGGGSWLYIEIDPGFPWPNVEAIFKLAMELRRGKEG